MAGTHGKRRRNLGLHRGSRPAVTGFGEAECGTPFLLERTGEFLEIFVDTPIEVCEPRDPKGLDK